jgi:hypothetical protein
MGSRVYESLFIPHVIGSDDELCSTVEEVSVSGD